MRYFTSDLHLGHANIIDYCGRPYTSVHEMHLDLVARWNDVVGQSDEVWVLGDVAMGHVPTSLGIVKRLHGTKHLIPGNHDKCWARSAKAASARSMYIEAGFVVHGSSEMLRINSTSVEACHFPFASDPDEGELAGREDRFAAWRPVERGQWLLCGHIHERWRQRGRMINVGVDAWAGRPVSDDELGALIAQGPSDLSPLAWE